VWRGDDDVPAQVGKQPNQVRQAVGPEGLDGGTLDQAADRFPFRLTSTNRCRRVVPGNGRQTRRGLSEADPSRLSGVTNA
jgi:hypothetical protein